MENNNKLFFAIIIGLSFIIGLYLAGNAHKYKYRKQQTIVVTGLAETDFVSDLIVWDGSYSRQSMDMKEAYSALKEDEKRLQHFCFQKESAKKKFHSKLLRLIRIL